jgi:hypothetical protein
VCEGLVLSLRPLRHRFFQIQRLMRVQAVLERHPGLNIAHAVKPGLGEDRPPDEEVEIGRDALDLGGAQAASIIAPSRPASRASEKKSANCSRRTKSITGTISFSRTPEKSPSKSTGS